MVAICLGVNDVRYPDRPVQAEQSRRRLPRGGVRWRRPARRPSAITTGDVASILEKHYGLFSVFSLLEGKTITDTVEQAAVGALEDFLATGRRRNRFLEDADLQPIEEAFRKALDDRAFDGRMPGTPTRAAQEGYNPRLAHPHSRSNPPRPSFIASGLLQAHFRAWVRD